MACSFLTSPEAAYRACGKLVPICLVLALALGLAGFYMAFFVAPIDATQGQSYRILFIHVGCAWMSMFLYVMMALWCAIGLAGRFPVAPMIASAVAPTGAMFTLLALLTGAFWGRPTWGTYWVWDARLTSELILFFLYLGFIALQGSISDVRRGDRASAVLAIVGVINVPIIYFSVQWWNTLHQGASITSRGSSMAPVMLATLLTMVFAVWIYAFAASAARLRSVILEREKRSEWAAQMVLKGRL